MKLVYHGVSREYNPPKVAYPSSRASNAIKERFRFLTLTDQERFENRQRSMLMRSLQSVGSDANVSDYSDHIAYS